MVKIHGQPCVTSKKNFYQAGRQQWEFRTRSYAGGTEQNGLCTPMEAGSWRLGILPNLTCKRPATWLACHAIDGSLRAPVHETDSQECGYVKSRTVQHRVILSTSGVGELRWCALALAARSCQAFFLWIWLTARCFIILNCCGLWFFIMFDYLFY
jgi:hypothetical protein